MAIINSGFGFIVVDVDPNVDITPNIGEDSEMAWQPTANQMWYWDRTTSVWLINPVTPFTFNLTDGVTTEVINSGDNLTVSGGDGLSIAVSATDTLTASLVLDPALSNIITNSATGLTATVVSGDGIAGVGTIADPLQINIDTVTAGNALMETPGEGLYVADELISNAGPLTGVAPVGAQGGIDTTNQTFYYVDGAGNWVQLPTTYTFSISDGTTTEVINTTDVINFVGSDNLSIIVSATDTVTADIILDPSTANITTSSATGILTSIVVGDSLAGDGTVASPLNVNIDTVTVGNALVETAGEGLYVPNEIVTGTTALAGTAPAGAEWGINTTDGTLYYVDGANTWTAVPVQYSFTITDGTTNETIVTGDNLTFADSATLDFTVAATDTVSAGVKLSATVGNDLVANADGLFVDVSALETLAVVTTDGTALGVAQSGVNDHTVDITLLSADAGNALSTGVDGGLFIAGSKGIFDNDVAAGVAGVLIGEEYELSAVNTYGLPEGLHKTRRN